MIPARQKRSFKLKVNTFSIGRWSSCFCCRVVPSSIKQTSCFASSFCCLASSFCVGGVVLSQSFTVPNFNNSVSANYFQLFWWSVEDAFSSEGKQNGWGNVPTSVSISTKTTDWSHFPHFISDPLRATQSLHHFWCGEIDGWHASIWNARLSLQKASEWPP